jgi:hypothetical protein
MWSYGYEQLRNGARQQRIWEWRWCLLVGGDSEGRKEEEGRVEMESIDLELSFSPFSCVETYVVAHHVHADRPHDGWSLSPVGHRKISNSELEGTESLRDPTDRRTLTL